MLFDIGTVLSISHDKLLAPIGKVYEILNYMLSDDLFTHQLPRAGKFCRNFIRAQHPQLDEWDTYNDAISTDNWKIYLREAERLFGKTLPIEKVPDGVWTYKNPITEASEMIGEENIIVIKAEPPEDNESTP